LHVSTPGGKPCDPSRSNFGASIDPGARALLPFAFEPIHRVAAHVTATPALGPPVAPS
jgi:hypothetical protein